MERNLLRDVHTEESVISHLIAQPHSYDEVSKLLDEDSFDDNDTKMFWKAIKWCNDTGKIPDLLYLQSLLGSKGRTEDIEKLKRIASAPISQNLRQQADILEEKRKERAYHDLRVELQMNEGDETAKMDEIISRFQERIGKHTASTIIDKSSLMQYAADIINNNSTGQPNKSVMTGFSFIDNLGGIPPESEVIVAAFSSQGKTAFALSVVNNSMKAGVNTAIYSAEMGKASLAGRFLNMNGWRVPISVFKTQPLYDATIDDFSRIAKDFIDRPGNIYIDDSSNNNADYICSSIRYLHRKHGIQLAVVDYLQIIALYDESNDSEQQKLATASRKFQKVAKELGIVIMVLSQFSRPSREQGHLPSEDLIRGSGQIYDACDIALYVYRPEKWEAEKYPAPYQDADKKGTAMIKIGKYRDGEADKSTIVGFDGPQTLFYEFAPGLYDDDPNKNYPKSQTIDVQDGTDKKPF